jgi:hypothetical protein
MAIEPSQRLRQIRGGQGHPGEFASLAQKALALFGALFFLRERDLEHALDPDGGPASDGDVPDFYLTSHSSNIIP